jgi:hypothetical protein
VNHNPDLYRRIFGTDIRRKYSRPRPDVLPDEPVEYDYEWRNGAMNWGCVHPWDREFTDRRKAAEESGDARELGDYYFAVRYGMETGRY